MPPNVSIRMTDSEITAACHRLGLPRPPTLPNAAPESSASPSDPDASGAVPVAPGVEDVLRTLGRPETVVFAHRQDSGAVVEIRVFAVSAPWAVEQIPEMESTYALSLFEAGEVVDRVASFCRLVHRDRPDAPDCQIAGSTWLHVLDRAASDPVGSVSILRADGIGARPAHTLAAAVAACQLLAQVTVVHRPTAGRLVGTTTSWIDAGPEGLWQVDAPKLARTGDHGDYGDVLLEEVVVTIAPVTRDALITEIERGFPSGK